MNKDVIYIEPEDDITDIITKIEKSKEKIVALVPPKKAGVFRSIVNIKLIAKAGTTNAKKVVLVTVDPSIVRLAAATKIPVTKDLQSAPVIPTTDNSEEVDTEEEDDKASGETEEQTEEDDEDETEKKEDDKNEGDNEDDNDEDEEPQEEEKKKAPKKTGKKSDNRFIGWIKDHKKTVIFGGLGLVILILVLIWALVIAPAVELNISIKTDSNNFSKNVTFTTKIEEENIAEGKFFLEEKKIENKQEIKFEATGEKNVGEKAKGELIIYSYFAAKGVNAINAGTYFSIGGLNYLADKDVTLSWDGNNKSCENDNIIVDGKIQCLISGKISVTAAEPGTKYNIVKSSTGWDASANVAAYSESEMSGGTDEMIKIVQQSDIDKAKEEIVTGNEAKDKEDLYEDIRDDQLKIESSFLQTTTDAETSPAVGEEVKDGVTPTLKAVSKTSIFVIDKTKVEEYIKTHVELSDEQKIYEIRNPFVENFTKTDSGYVGKLKAVYYTGPKITETSIVDLVKGRGLGDAQHALKDINGITDVRINPSHKWVTSIPNDPNRITIYFDIKDQNGNKIEPIVDAEKEPEAETKEEENDKEESSEEKKED